MPTSSPNVTSFAQRGLMAKNKAAESASACHIFMPHDSEDAA